MMRKLFPYKKPKKVQDLRIPIPSLAAIYKTDLSEAQIDALLTGREPRGRPERHAVCPSPILAMPKPRRSRHFIINHQEGDKTLVEATHSSEHADSERTMSVALANHAPEDSRIETDVKSDTSQHGSEIRTASLSSSPSSTYESARQSPLPDPLAPPQEATTKTHDQTTTAEPVKDTAATSSAFELKSLQRQLQIIQDRIHQDRTHPQEPRLHKENKSDSGNHDTQTSTRPRSLRGEPVSAGHQEDRSRDHRQHQSLENASEQRQFFANVAGAATTPRNRRRPTPRASRSADDRLGMDDIIYCFSSSDEDEYPRRRGARDVRKQKRAPIKRNRNRSMDYHSEVEEHEMVEPLLPLEFHRGRNHVRPLSQRRGRSVTPRFSYYPSRTPVGNQRQGVQYPAQYYGSLPASYIRQQYTASDIPIAAYRPYVVYHPMQSLEPLAVPTAIYGQYPQSPDWTTLPTPGYSPGFSGLPPGVMRGEYNPRQMRRRQSTDSNAPHGDQSLPRYVYSNPMEIYTDMYPGLQGNANFYR